jgi:hypothetical protein
MSIAVGVCFDIFVSVVFNEICFITRGPMSSVAFRVTLSEADYHWTSYV